MSEKPISELRRRMLEDMAVRKFGAALIEAYEVERGFADVDADRRDAGCSPGWVGAHRRLLELLLTPPSRCRSL